MPDTHPYSSKISENVPDVATATDDTKILAEAQFACTVSEVTYTPDAALTGANTNTRRVALLNKGTDGTGTDIIAELQFNSGVNMAAGDEKTITLSGTAANLEVAEGEILAWESEAVGTGIADPGGLVQVTLTRA